MAQEKRVAVFPGSFDPFTVGHKAVIDSALPLFDKIIVAIGVNAGKKTCFGTAERVEQISALYAGEARVEVAVYEGLTVDFCKARGAQCLIRGLRNASDFEYESAMAQVNRQLAGIETVFFAAPAELAHISSSVVRDLLSHGCDVSRYSPVTFEHSKQ